MASKSPIFGILALFVGTFPEQTRGKSRLSGQIHFEAFLDVPHPRNGLISILSDLKNMSAHPFIKKKLFFLNMGENRDWKLLSWAKIAIFGFWAIFAKIECTG